MVDPNSAAVRKKREVGRAWGRDKSLNYDCCLLVSPNSLMVGLSWVQFSVLPQFHAAESSVWQMFLLHSASAALRLSCNFFPWEELKSQAHHFSSITRLIVRQNKYLSYNYEKGLRPYFNLFGCKGHNVPTSETVQISLVRYRADLYLCSFAHSCSREHTEFGATGLQI